MKIWILSDLHCSLRDLGVLLMDPPDHDVCVLAGDLAAGLVSQIDMIDQVAVRPTILVAGNHEYWHRVRSSELMAAGMAAARSRRVRFLENGVAVVGGVRFLGATLWSDFALYGADARGVAMAHAREHNSDFGLIVREPSSPLSIGPASLWSPEDARRTHLETRAWMEERFAEPFAGRTVVVTHHAPSIGSLGQRWRGDAGSPAYASRLEDRIRRWAPWLWIHGHLHESADYQIGDERSSTRVVCNPRGFEAENPSFDPRLVVEV